MKHPQAFVAACMTFFVFSGCYSSHPAADSSTPASPCLKEATLTGSMAKTLAEWAGTYHGILPCADCEGIETIITLNADGTYSKTMRYLGKKPATFVDEGRFSRSPGTDCIHLSGYDCGPDHYLVGDDKLIQLDMDKQRITGTLAEHYILRKRK